MRAAARLTSRPLQYDVEGCGLECRCTLRLVLDPTREQSTLSGFLGRLRTAFAPFDRAALRLRASVGRNRGLLLALGDALPSGAEGFRARLYDPPTIHGSIPTAPARRRASAATDIGITAYDGNLLEHFGWDASIRLIERCVTSDPSWLRGARLSFDADRLVLAGRPTGPVWRVFADNLAPHSAKRISAHVQTSLEVESTDSAAVKRVLKELEPISGFPLRRAHIRFAPDAVSAEDGETAQRMRAFTELQHELVASIAETLRSNGLRWQDFPRLVTRAGAYNRRMGAVVGGAGTGRVDFAASVRRFARVAFPDFQMRKTMDEIELARPLTEDGELCVTLNKIHFSGLGKTYSARLGIRATRGQLGGRYFGGSLFQCFDNGSTDSSLAWSYDATEDLALDLEETRKLLNLVLPIFESEWTTFLRFGRSPLLEQQPEQGALTFHDAVRIAARALGGFEPAFPCLYGAWLRPYTANAIGRLGPGQEWRVRFANRATGQSVAVVLPWRGRIRFEQDYGLYVDHDGVKTFKDGSPAPQRKLMLEEASAPDSGALMQDLEARLTGYADSPDILACAEAAGGASFRRHHPLCRGELVFRVELKEGSASDEYWSVSYRAAGNASHDSLALKLPARPPLVAEIIAPAHPLASAVPKGSA
jgi:hypothetical protein